MSFFFFQAEDGIRDIGVTGVQTCALPISLPRRRGRAWSCRARPECYLPRWLRTGPAGPSVETSARRTTTRAAQGTPSARTTDRARFRRLRGRARRARRRRDGTPARWPGRSRSRRHRGSRPPAGLAAGLGPPRPRSCGRRWAERWGRAGSGPPRPAASAPRLRRCAPRGLRPEGCPTPSPPDRSERARPTVGARPRRRTTRESAATRPLAPHQPQLRVAAVVERPGIERDDGVDGGVVALDARQARLDDLDGRHIARPDEPRELGGGAIR